MINLTRFWKTNQIVIITLGLFRFIGQSNSYTHTLPIRITRGFSGTKGFVAPEVAHVSKAKERSIYNHMADVFSFGMLLYQMIARQRPFHNLPSYSVQPQLKMDSVQV